jgi:hypothetical protein
VTKQNLARAADDIQQQMILVRFLRKVRSLASREFRSSSGAAYDPVGWLEVQMKQVMKFTHNVTFHMYI